MTKYEKHIRELCKEFNITIRFSPGQNEASMLGKIIWINKTIKSVRTYVSALHEIGHVVNEYTKNKNRWHKISVNYSRSNNEKNCFTSKYVMKCEINAWKTARKLAKWWDHSADKRELSSLFTYVVGYNTSHKNLFLGLKTSFIEDIEEFLFNDKEIVGDLIKRIHNLTS